MNKTESWNKVELDPDAIASPCGIIAATFFNDTFALQNQNETISIN